MLKKKKRGKKMSNKFDWIVVSLISCLILSPILYSLNFVIYETNIGEVSFYSFGILSIVFIVLPYPKEKECEQKWKKKKLKVYSQQWILI